MPLTHLRHPLASLVLALTVCGCCGQNDDQAAYRPINRSTGGASPDGTSAGGPATTVPATAMAMPPVATVITTQVASTDWRPLFDGKSMDGWKASEFAGHGEPAIEDGAIFLPPGEGLTGVTCTRTVPTMNYEVSLEARKVDGIDFFCGLTFPVAKSHATLVCGGWGGTVVGISSINGDDASSNETTSSHKFEKDRWYKVRVRVTPHRLQAWIDDARVVDVSTDEKQVDIRPDIDESKPLGIAAWRTTAALRAVKIRDVGAAEGPEK